LTMRGDTAYQYARSRKFAMKSANEHEPGPGRGSLESVPGNAAPLPEVPARMNENGWRGARGGESASG